MTTFKKKFLRFFFSRLAVPLATALFGMILVACYLYMRTEDARYAQTIDKMVTTERLMIMDNNVRTTFHKLHEITNVATLFVRSNPDISEQDFYRLIATVISQGTGDMIKD